MAQDLNYEEIVECLLLEYLEKRPFCAKENIPSIPTPTPTPHPIFDGIHDVLRNYLLGANPHRYPSDSAYNLMLDEMYKNFLEYLEKKPSSENVSTIPSIPTVNNTPDPRFHNILMEISFVVRDFVARCGIESLLDIESLSELLTNIDNNDSSRKLA